MLTKQLDIVDVESSFSINILCLKKLIKECCEVYFCSLLKLFQTPGNPLMTLKIIRIKIHTKVVTVSTKHTTSAITCPILKLILQTT